MKKHAAFISSLNFLVINTEIELILKWNQICVLRGKATREAKAEITVGKNNVPPRQEAVY